MLVTTNKYMLYYLIFTDIIIHAKVFSVTAMSVTIMSVTIMSDKVVRFCKYFLYVFRKRLLRI